MNTSTFSATERTTWLSKLESESFDLLVIGGGITGAGIALDAATRGLKVALIEKKILLGVQAAAPPNSFMVGCAI